MNFSLLILLGQATAGAHCREELRPLNRPLSRREHAEIREEPRPLNRSIKRRVPTKFGQSRCTIGCALTGNLEPSKKKNTRGSGV